MIPAKLIDLEHVGTRREHYMDLIEHFSSAIALADKYSIGTKRVENMCEEMEVVITYVRRLVMRDYDDSNYRREINRASSARPTTSSPRSRSTDPRMP